MKQYKVEITREALQDMEDIYNYIAVDLLSPENAMGQYNRIADEILTLDSFPERYGIKVIVTDVLYTASDIEVRLRGV